MKEKYITKSEARQVILELVRQEMEALQQIPFGSDCPDDTPITSLKLPIRIRTVLNNAEIKTVGGLCKMTEQDLMKHRNFGRKSADELKIILGQHGRGLKF